MRAAGIVKRICPMIWSNRGKFRVRNIILGVERGLWEKFYI